MNIFSTAPITYAQAALGGRCENQHCGRRCGIYSEARHTDRHQDPPERQRSSFLRNKNIRGDHYVTLVVQVPTGLNEEAKEALRRFDEACGNCPAESKGDGSEKKKKSFMDKLKETLRITKV